VWFTASPLLSSSISLKKVHGDLQAGVVGTALAEPVIVAAQLPDGRGVVGVPVSWSPGPAIFGSTVAGSADVTDSLGQIERIWTMGTLQGFYWLTASIAGIDTVTFTTTAGPGPVYGLIKNKGDGQSGPVGQPLTTPLRVLVADQYGNGVPDQAVNWSVALGGGYLSSAEDTSDVFGYARATLVLGPSAGLNEVVAANGQLEVRFVATGF
jgi:hypothetical protein